MVNTETLAVAMAASNKEMLEMVREDSKASTLAVQQMCNAVMSLAQCIGSVRMLPAPSSPHTRLLATPESAPAPVNRRVCEEVTPDTGAAPANLRILGELPLLFAAAALKLGFDQQDGITFVRPVADARLLVSVVAATRYIRHQQEKKNLTAATLRGMLVAEFGAVGARSTEPYAELARLQGLFGVSQTQTKQKSGARLSDGFVYLHAQRLVGLLRQMLTNRSELITTDQTAKSTVVDMARGINFRKRPFESTPSSDTIVQGKKWSVAQVVECQADTIAHASVMRAAAGLTPNPIARPNGTMICGPNWSMMQMPQRGREIPAPGDRV